MPDALTSLKVFIASPSGLEKEREAFREVIAEVNQADAIPRGILFVPVGWEDTLGGVGRPQSVINDEVRQSNYSVMLLRDRWGSPTGDGPNDYTSGTEEEYHLAMECCADGTMRNMVIMFRQVSTEQLSNPGPQLQKVLDFRMQLEREQQHLFHTYDSPARFKKLLRRHLAQWIRDEEKRRASGPAAPPGAVDLGADSGLTDAGPLAVDDTFGPAVVSEAWSLAEDGRLTEAEMEFAKAIVAERSAHPLIDYAVFVHRLGRVDQAEALLRSSIEVATDQKDNRALARAYTALGIVFEAHGDLDSAEEMNQKALEEYGRLGQPEGLADTYGNLGIVLEIRGDLEGAEGMQRKALEINEGLGRLERMANAYGNLGFILKARGDVDGAEEMHRKALEIHQRLGRRDGMASAYGNVGNILATRGDLDGAEEMHRKALEIDESLGRLEGVADDFGNLGNVLKQRGDLEGAEDLLRKALEIHERLGRLEGIATAYNSLGTVLEARGDLDGAEEILRKALTIGERLGWPEGMARVYGNLSRILKARGDVDGAEEMHRKALEISEQLGSRSA